MVLSSLGRETGALEDKTRFSVGMWALKSPGFRGGGGGQRRVDALVGVCVLSGIRVAISQCQEALLQMQQNIEVCQRMVATVAVTMMIKTFSTS